MNEIIEDSCNRYQYKRGSLYWKTGHRKGDRAGWIGGNGYRYVRLTGKTMLEHRVIYAIHHGELPSSVDHINGSPLDNRIENLRGCRHRQNLCNSGARSNNTSGFKGVSWSKQHKKWTAQIGHKMKNVNLGLYVNKEDAARAYDEAALALHGEFARTNQSLGLL